MLERRHLVMAFANRGKAGLDQLLHDRVQIPVLQRAFKLRLDMIFAAFDLGNDRRIVAVTGQRVAQAQKSAAPPSAYSSNDST